MKKVALSLVLFLLATAPFVGIAQDASKPPATKVADPSAKADAKAAEAKATDDKSDSKSGEKKSTNRLPSNYGKLGISDAQRTKIYAVQDKHENEIDGLNDKLKAAKAKRDAEVEAVLTADQKKMLKDLTASKESKTATKDDKPEAKMDAKDKK